MPLSPDAVKHADYDRVLEEYQVAPCVFGEKAPFLRVALYSYSRIHNRMAGTGAHAAGGNWCEREHASPLGRECATAARTRARAHYLFHQHACIRIDNGAQTIVGINRFKLDQEADMELLRVDNSAVRTAQLERLAKLKAERDSSAVEAALAAITEAAQPDATGIKLRIHNSFYLFD